MKIPHYLCLIILLLLNVKPLQAQSPRKQYERKNATGKTFLDKQFWIGIRGGMNLTAANPTERHSVFSSMNGNNEQYNKEYKQFHQPGALIGLDFTFNYKAFSISFQPNYRRQRFMYTNSYTWSDPEEDQFLELQYKQEHQLDYLELPLFVKYDILQNAIRPFVQAGFYYATLNTANKSVYISGTDNASGGTPFENQPIIIGAGDLFINSSLGFAGGVGVSWDLGNVRLVFDATYRHGTNNITNRANRFTNNQLAGSGDALDDMKLRNITFALGIALPTRFLSTSAYKSTEKKQ
ncbi:MAG: outer membrane beta-barrel protein [Cytophagaceae bacterium]